MTSIEDIDFKNTITAKCTLKKVGKLPDFSKYFNLSSYVEKKEVYENSSLVKYFLKNGGEIELKNEKTPKEDVIIDFNKCPVRLYNKFNKVMNGIEFKIIMNRINKLDNIKK